jgi:VanZ family protein
MSLRIIWPLLWLTFITILFCLPGSAFPKADFLSKIWFDKWVHIGFFTVLLFLWNWAFRLNKRGDFYLILLLAILYGFLIEVVQHYLIINRSFDLGDLVADTIGSLVGLWTWSLYKKNRPL